MRREKKITEDYIKKIHQNILLDDALEVSRITGMPMEGLIMCEHDFIVAANQNLVCKKCGHSEKMAYNNEELIKLHDICTNFIRKNKIRCSETIYQSDMVSIESLDFIEDICNLVGYYK